MTTVIVRSNQDLYDICLQEYGEIDFFRKIIEDNNLNLAGNIVQGQELIIDSEQKGDEDVKDFFELKNKHPQNGYIFKNNIPPLNWDNTNITWDSIIETFDLIKI